MRSPKFGAGRFVGGKPVLHLLNALLRLSLCYLCPSTINGSQGFPHLQPLILRERNNRLGGLFNNCNFAAQLVYISFKV